MRTLVVLLLVASLLPSLAAAQTAPDAQANRPTLIVTLEDPGRAMTPGGNESILVKVNYQNGAASAPGPLPDMNDPTATTTAPTQITFAVKDKPAWIQNVSFAPPVVFVNTTPGLRTSDAGATKAILKIAPDAPADLRGNITVEATSSANGGTPSVTATYSLMLHPGLATKVKVVPKDPNALAIVKGGRWQPISFLVTNLGNGQFTSRLNVTSRPQDSIVDVPTTITLNAGETQEVVVLLKLPWTYGEEGSLTLEAVPLIPPDGTEGKAVHADAEIMGQSAVSDLTPLVVLGLLGGIALLRRK